MDEPDAALHKSFITNKVYTVEDLLPDHRSRLIGESLTSILNLNPVLMCPRRAETLTILQTWKRNSFGFAIRTAWEQTCLSLLSKYITESIRKCHELTCSLPVCESVAACNSVAQMLTV